jgi:hypothetical protein
VTLIAWHARCFVRTVMRLVDVLLRASLVAVSACDCPDGKVETSAFMPRKLYFQQIDACIANDSRCEALCRAALELEPEIAITKCVITSANREGAQVDIEYLEPIDCGAGRKPDGFHAPRRRAGIGAWLAGVATLEAASVTAFARLARALARFEAPAKLGLAAKRAIADELAHAAAIGKLARRHGGRVEAPVIDRARDATIEQLAVENAVEGRVGETFGALVAACQARAAMDAEVRAVFGAIAIDEARHAALAHQLAPWFERRLGWRERNAVARARQDAIARVIATSCDFGLSTAERDELGLPAPDRLRAAALQLFATIG